jgi:cytochrome c553
MAICGNRAKQAARRNRLKKKHKLTKLWARGDKQASAAGEGLPQSGRSLRQGDPATRLILAGDPSRGVPPCAACHGPGAQKLGAPVLQGQHAAYIERQLAAFAQGMRQNDINEQMRAIAAQLTPDEMHAVAAYYGAEATYERH